MSNPAFILANENLTYDPAFPSLCTDEPHICYGTKTPIPPPPPRPPVRRERVSGGGACAPAFCQNATLVKRFARVAKNMVRSPGGSKDAPLKRPEPRERSKVYDLKAKILDLRRRIDDLEEKRRLDMERADDDARMICRLEREGRAAEARALAEAARASMERAGHAAAIALIADDLGRLEGLVRAGTDALTVERAARHEGGWWLVAAGALAATLVIAPVPAVARVAGLGISFGCLAVAVARLLTPISEP